jgi:hypothetical protein
MAIISGIIQPRRGTAAAWAAANTILTTGETGYETDTKKEKTGDGTTPWNDLDYAFTVDQTARTAASAAQSTANAAIPATQKGAANGVSSLGTDIKVPIAQLPTGTTSSTVALGDAPAAAAASAVSAIPDATTSAHGLESAADKTKIDGIATGATVGADWSTNVANKPTLGTASTHAATDFEASGAAATVQGHLDTHAGLTTTAHGGVVASSSLGAASGVATLGSDQKLTASQLPDLAISDYLGSVANQVAMLGLVGQKGDYCTRSDLGTMWIITGSNPTQLGSWLQTVYPAAPVSSVAGRTGAITLAESDITNLATDLTARALKQGGTLDGATSLGVRDTSANHDVKIAAASSIALTGDRSLTVDVVNADRTLRLSGDAEVRGTNTGDESATTERPIPGTTDTFVLADMNNLVKATNASSTTGTIPLHSVVAFPAGAMIMVRAGGTGTFTIASGGGGPTVNGPSLVIPSGQSATLIQSTTPDTWDLVLVSKASLGLENVTNNAQTEASIVPNTIPTAGQIPVGNAGGTAYAPVSASGDVTLSSAGVFTAQAPTAATYTPATGAQTVGLNCAGKDVHFVTGHASGTAITFTITGDTNNQIFVIVLSQGAVASTITAWFSTIRWNTPGGTAPSLSAASEHITFGFIKTGSATYDGFLIGKES